MEIPDDLIRCQELVRKLDQERQELQLTVARLMERIYGRRRERFVNADQMSLDFGDGVPLEVSVIPEPSTENDPQDEATTPAKKKPKRKQQQRTGKFPEHLERRVERIVPNLPEGITLEDCRVIGIDRVEQLEFEPSRLWVRVFEYLKVTIAERRDLQIVQAPRVASLVEGGSFGFGVAAEVLFNKFAQHVPLYRQQDRFAQLGWSPNRSTLCNIVCHSANLLHPLAERLRERILQSNIINTDDTTVTLLTPGQEPGARTARFWTYRGRDSAPYSAFAFTESRERTGPDEYLKGFQGTLCGDCYSGYVNVEQVTGGRILFSACNAHARRYVFQGREEHLEWSQQVLGIYRALYDVEDRSRHFTPDERLLLRMRESAPLVLKLKEVIDHPLTDKFLPKSGLGKSVRYIHRNWKSLTHFLLDGNVPIDNNDAERELRRVAIGRNNWMFVGSEQGGERTSIILTVLASAHRHDLDEWAYLRDVLEQLARGPTNLDDLLPDNWRKSHPDKVRTFRAEERERRAEVRSIARTKRRQSNPSPAPVL